MHEQIRQAIEQLRTGLQRSDEAAERHNWAEARGILAGRVDIALEILADALQSEAPTAAETVGASHGL